MLTCGRRRRIKPINLGIFLFFQPLLLRVPGLEASLIVYRMGPLGYKIPIIGYQ